MGKGPVMGLAKMKSEVGQDICLFVLGIGVQILEAAVEEPLEAMPGFPEALSVSQRPASNTIMAKGNRRFCLQRVSHLRCSKAFIWAGANGRESPEATVNR